MTRSAFLIAVLGIATAVAADIKVDLKGEQVGKPPAAFEPMVGTWVVAQDGGEKVIMLDGRNTERPHCTRSER